MITPISPTTASQAYIRPEADGARAQARPVSAEGQSGIAAASAKAASVTGECQTCKNRKYQDGSNDPGVSFKSAAHVSPQASAAAVSSHEGEHVSREQSKAQNEGREVVYQTVRISTAKCPECGKTYVSGGETTTATRSKPKSPEPGVGESVDFYA